ncbi:hypothetical protein BV20DRAFT_1113012, partial [Pilatotrama ljubarskyi]
MANSLEHRCSVLTMLKFLKFLRKRRPRAGRSQSRDVHQAVGGNTNAGGPPNDSSQAETVSFVLEWRARNACAEDAEVVALRTLSNAQQAINRLPVELLVEIFLQIPGENHLGDLLNTTRN